MPDTTPEPDDTREPGGTPEPEGTPEPDVEARDARSLGGLMAAAFGPRSVAHELAPGLQVLRSLFGAAACSCALVDSAGEQLTFVAADGAGADAIVGVSIPVGRGIAGWVCLSGEPIAVADVARDTRFARDVAEATAYVPTTILAAPLLGGAGDVVGVVEVLDPVRREEESRVGAHRGTSADLAVLSAAATQMSTVVRLAGRFTELGTAVLAALGSTDPGPTGEAPTGEGSQAELTSVAEAFRALAGSGPAEAALARDVLASVAAYARTRR